MLICEIDSKLVVEDDYAKGEIGQTTDIPMEVILSADTQEELLEKIAEFTGVQVRDILPEEDDPSLLTTSLLEDRDGNLPTPSMIAMWKQGKARLWHVTYLMSCYQKVPAPFTSLLNKHA